MRDYRVLKRYTMDQWEDDDEWKAARLDFIWCIRDYYPKKYMELELNEEKNDFYSINNNEVSRLASNLHYSIDMDYYNSIMKVLSLDSQYSMLKKLNDMKYNNIKQFIRKNNCNLYEYLKMRRDNGDYYDVEREDKYNQQFV